VNLVCNQLDIYDHHAFLVLALAQPFQYAEDAVLALHLTQYRLDRHGAEVVDAYAQDQPVCA